MMRWFLQDAHGQKAPRVFIGTTITPTKLVNVINGTEFPASVGITFPCETWMSFPR